MKAEPQDIKDSFIALDVNNDSTIQFEEFIALLKWSTYYISPSITYIHYILYIYYISTIYLFMYLFMYLVYIYLCIDILIVLMKLIFSCPFPFSRASVGPEIVLEELLPLC